MTLKINKIAIVSLISIAVISSCKKESIIPYDCSGVTPTYITDIKPIMDNSCAISGCHSASSKADGKDYSSYASVKSSASSNSFMGSMQHLKGYESMPKGGSKLSDDQLKTIYCWIQNGTPQ